MEAAGPSETSIPIKLIAQHHIPEDSNLIYCRGNRKFHIVMLVYPVLTTLSASEVIFKLRCSRVFKNVGGGGHPRNYPRVRRDMLNKQTEFYFRGKKNRNVGSS